MKNIGPIVTRSSIIALAAIAVGCGSAPPTIQTGPDAEVTFDGLHRVDNSRADMAWAHPEFDISGYSAIMLVGAGIEYAPANNRGRTSVDRSRAGPYFINDETRERFESLVTETFIDEISRIENFEIVNEPGPEVMMIRGGLLDVVSFVPQDSMNMTGRSNVFLSTVGEATLVLELRDSQSGAILARSIDRRAAETAGGTFMDSNRVTNAAEVRRLIRFWARRLREGLDGFVEQQANSN